jgi:hypothetical protein
VRAAAFVLLLAAPAGAQMVDPAIDGAGPFSYFSRSTDQLAVIDAPYGSELTPEGFVYTGFGELMFFTGNPPRPTEARVRVPWTGPLPIYRFTMRDDALTWSFDYLAAPADAEAGAPSANFVRVTVKNDGRAPRTAWLTTAVRYQADSTVPGAVGDHRFKRPLVPQRPGDYDHAGVDFDPAWAYRFDGNTFVRGERVLYLFPADREREAEPSMALAWRYNRPPGDLAGLRVLPTTPMGVVAYRLPLAPGETLRLDYVMPVVPPAPGSPELERLRRATFDEASARMTREWEAQLARGLQIRVPEAKVNDTFRASLAYDLGAKRRVGADVIQTVNRLNYHAFWLRDAAAIARMYDLSGLHDTAREVIDFFARWQQEDGNFASRPGQLDGWGQTLWVYGQHYVLTRDAEFARRVFPAVRRAVAWLEAARARDPLRLLPVATPGDNERITGRVTGHNFWALLGLRHAALIAEGAGDPDTARAWRAARDDYQAALDAVLTRITASTGGYVPPGLDEAGGQDWGNMLMLAPEPLYAPDHPWVTATLARTRAKYAEGLMTYGDGRFIHHYLTIENTEAAVARGEQRIAVEELYALLVHTSSTHAGFEYAIRPWGTREADSNLAPHGWFAAKYRTLLRNMLVREQGRELHLLSVVAPEWLRPGEVIEVRDAPTDFGPVSFVLRVISPDEARLSLDARFHTRPEAVLLHVPWFVEGAGAPITVAPDTRELRLRWKKRRDTPKLSYAAAVEAYKVEYRRRWEIFRETGR